MGGVDIAMTLASKQDVLTTSSALSVASVSLPVVATAITGKQAALTTSSSLSVAAVTIAGVNVATALNGKQA